MRDETGHKYHPALYFSTYETHFSIKNQSLSSKEKLVEGYKIQSELVMHKTTDVVLQHVERNTPIILEGVHLTGNHLENIRSRLPNHWIFVPVLIHVMDEVSLSSVHAF